MNANVAPECVAPDASSGVARSAMFGVGNVSDGCEAEREPRLGSTPAALVASLRGADEAFAPTQSMWRTDE